MASYIDQGNGRWDCAVVLMSAFNRLVKSEVRGQHLVASTTCSN